MAFILFFDKAIKNKTSIFEAMKKVWYPYQQMQNSEEPFKVQSAEGVVMTLDNGQKVIDAVSSWWASIHGYNHPLLNKALTDQLDRFSHVMLGGLTHDPALSLADRLISITPEGLNHVFYSDSGSVGVEVAIKIAIQYWLNKGIKGKHKMLSLTKAYHGDTFKAMEVGADDDFHVTYQGIINKDFIASAPTCRFGEHSGEELLSDLEAIGAVIKANHTEIAACILEPMVQCAGGFNMYRADYLIGLKRLCEEYNILLIFDEVATGFGRTGRLFAADHASLTPDIMILGKALTAGYMGHAATLVTTPIFEGFYGTSYHQALMHGPTFMGNALACSVALAGIEIFEKDAYLERIQNIEKILQRELIEQWDWQQIEIIKDVRVMGAIGVIETRSSENITGFQRYAIEQNVWIRPFLDYVYTMPPYIISEEQLIQVTTVMKGWFTR